MPTDNDPQPQLIRTPYMVFVGNQGCGKTSLIRKLVGTEENFLPRTSTRCPLVINLFKIEDILHGDYGHFEHTKYDLVHSKTFPEIEDEIQAETQRRLKKYGLLISRKYMELFVHSGDAGILSNMTVMDLPGIESMTLEETKRYIDRPSVTIVAVSRPGDDPRLVSNLLNEIDPSGSRTVRVEYRDDLDAAQTRAILDDILRTARIVAMVPPVRGPGPPPPIPCSLLRLRV